MSKRLITCPYNEAHKVKESRFQFHISKCRENPDDVSFEKFICPFNATHVMTKAERTYHLQHCPDRAPVDRKLSQSLNNNNPYKGRTAVPSYDESPQILADEDWDLDNGESVAVGKEAPQGAIIQPPPNSKPAYRRQLYQDLHRTEDVQPEYPQVSTETVPKIPKQPDTVSKIEALRKRDDLLNLGQNGTIPPQRLAANLFTSQVNNSVSNDLKNLSISKEGSRGVGFQPDENDFPVLGVGRGRAARH